MTVFLESEEFGYEEFKADGIEAALQMIKNIYNVADGLADGVNRTIGIKT